jgi:gluconolactonase
MPKSTTCLLVALALMGVTAPAWAKPVALFDGKTFAGWDGDTKETWSIKDGCIVGGTLTKKIARNQFLATTASYKDFVLRLKFKLLGDSKKGFVNSGVQIRSQRVPKDTEMTGYQADLGDPGWWGSLYDESRRNKVLAQSDMAKLNKVLKRGDWNDYEIRCEGRRLRTWINGVLGVDYTEPDEKIPQEGRIGLQIHSGGPAEVWFKDLTIEELPAAPAGGRGAGTSVAAPGAKLEKLAGDFKFTEGPAADAEGNVYFTDQPNDRILRWGVDGKLSTFMQPCGRSNGLCFDAKGNLWACADEKNELWSISPDKKVTVVVKDYQGKLLNGPNDIWIRPDQGVYLTDPYYKRPYWKRGPAEQDRQAVYYLAPDHKKLVRVIDDLKQPNGIIGTPDGKTLYVADIGGGRTYAYDIQPDGALANKRLFCKLGSDGMTIDSDGNVYLTGKGVIVFDRTGKQIEHIAVPEPWTANVCFGGRDRQTLFITAWRGLYALRTRVKGVGSQ